MRCRWQKNMKNRDSVLTRFGKSLIVPPAIRLLTSVRQNLINKIFAGQKETHRTVSCVPAKTFRAAFEPIAPGSDRSPMPPWDPSLPGFFIAG
jgi:hypothetical protein